MRHGRDCALFLFRKLNRAEERKRKMKTILLFPPKVIWFLIKLPFKILGFMFKHSSVETSNWRG